MSTQSANTPLWKVLNGVRYRGPWKITNIDCSDGCHIYITTDQDLPIIDFGMKGDSLSERSAEYTALAVNEFANVVGALQELNNSVCGDVFTDDEKTERLIKAMYAAKTVLARIS